MKWSDRLGLGYSYATSLLAYMVDGPPRPFSATFIVTNRCNLRCAYCNCPYIDPSDLDLARIETVFDRLAAIGVKRLGLAGGEPLLRPDLPDIVDAAKQRGFFVSINSNLTLYKRHPERLAKADLVYTSLDGDEAAHIAARGRHAHTGVLEAIADLHRAGKPVVAICVVTEHSIGQAEFLLDQAERLGYRMHFQPQCVDTEIVRGEAPPISNERLREFWRGLLEAKRRGRPIVSSTPYLEYLAEWQDFTVSAVHDPKVRCGAGYGYLYVDPKGMAYACAYTKKKMDAVDLLADDWRATWNRETPCTRCSVGPMLEFNMLFQRPFAAAREAMRSYS